MKGPEAPQHQKFFILWVDDQPDSVKSSKTEVTTNFKEKYADVDIDIIDSEKYQDALGKMKTHNVEVVVTDYNLEEGKSGLDVLRSIRTINFATDVLFYCAKGTLKGETKKEIEKYDFVQMIEGKSKIAAALSILIDKHLKRFNDIVFLRGMVLSNVIELELKMNNFLACYLKIPSTKEEAFHNFIMENSANQASGKRSAIFNIISENPRKVIIRKDFGAFAKKDEFEKFMGDLRNIETSRNQLAHCRLSKKNDDTLIVQGTAVEFKKKDLNKLLERIRNSSVYLDMLVEKIK